MDQTRALTYTSGMKRPKKSYFELSPLERESELHAHLKAAKKRDRVGAYVLWGILILILGLGAWGQLHSKNPDAGTCASWPHCPQ